MTHENAASATTRNQRPAAALNPIKMELMMVDAPSPQEPAIVVSDDEAVGMSPHVLTPFSR